MLDTWCRSIQENIHNVSNSIGPELVIAVTGTQLDREFWRSAILKRRHDVFRADGKTSFMVISEGAKKGNFLGTLNAWHSTVKNSELARRNRPPISLMTMVFGRGTRLSPFTQAMGDRKPAFPLPRKAYHSNTYINAADLSNLYSNRWLEHLKSCGFRGVVVKWGDESIVPGIRWLSNPEKYANVDAVRFVWKTPITESLAREKEWIVIDSKTGLMRFQYARHNSETLKRRLAQLPEGAFEMSVNLGSLAISYECLDIATEIFSDDLADAHRWVDWDPYVWIALSCSSRADWEDEIAFEESIGKNGIIELEKRFPDFFSKVMLFRKAVENHKGRPFRIGVLDFGEAFWTDIGLHLSLRDCFQSMALETDRGKATRELFGIPHKRDDRGNIIVNSVISPNATIRDSVILDSMIDDPKSVISRGVVIGGRHGILSMPNGGVAFHSAINRLHFEGPNGFVFRTVGDEFHVSEGGRLTTLPLEDGWVSMRSNESVLDYSGSNYTQPILGNPLSFEDAGSIMSQKYRGDSEELWQEVLDNWLEKYRS